MAKKKACIAALAGYMRSAVALAGDEISSVPGMEPVPDLMASLVWCFGEIQHYDRSRQRSHLEEVWKKRLAYGFATAQQLEEERRLHGVELTDADWSTLSEHLDRLMGKRSSSHSFLSDVA